MINKEIIKDYAEYHCDRLAYLMGNERHLMQVLKTLFEANLQMKDFEELVSSDEEEDEEEISADRFQEWMRIYPELFDKLLADAKAIAADDPATQIIAQWEDLQEVSKLSRHYFETLYPGLTRRADTMDGSIDSFEDRKVASIEERTQRYLSDPTVKVIFEGQVSTEGFLARWDVLVKENDGYHIYEVKGSTSVFSTNKRDETSNQNLPKSLRKPYLYDLAFQQWVYQRAGMDLGAVHFIHLDRNATFQEEEMSYPLDQSLLTKLFRSASEIEDSSVKGKEKPLIPLAEYLERRLYVKTNYDPVEIYAFHLESLLSLPQVPEVKLIYKCRKCPLRDFCHPQIDSDHILKLNCYGATGGKWRAVKQLIEEDKILSIPNINDFFVEANFGWELKPKDGVPRLSSARYQIDTMKNYLTKQHYLVPTIIENLLQRDYQVFPLIFFDFETFNYPIPLVAGAHPNQQVCCQYSMHVVESNYDLFQHDFEQGRGGGITHYEFLGTPSKDGFRNPERALIQTLKNQLISAGVNPNQDHFTLVVYNKSFEQSRFRDMSKQYPEESEFLLRCHRRIVDLLDFFQSGGWYHRDFHGRSSLKVTQPVLMGDQGIQQWYQDLPYSLENTLSYHSGMIHNGGIALAVYQTLLRRYFLTGEPSDEELFRQALLAYCKIDSWGTVILYDVIQKAIKRIQTNTMDLDWALIDTHFLPR